MARVFRADQLWDPASADASDPLLRAAALSYFPGRSGDLVMALKPGWMAAATGTTHGSANADDQRVPVLLMGAGIRPGRYLDRATPADVVPTLAAVCRIKLPSAEGHPLREALLIRPAVRSTSN